MEALINSQMKQLKSLLNCLNKRKEALGEDKEDDLSASVDELTPRSRRRSQSDTVREGLKKSHKLGIFAQPPLIPPSLLNLGPLIRLHIFSA